ncbi:hypothetical protein SCP_1402890 [Sparassis crispa]|uniref:Uncharacterized protein n=1 Tax=Sparassis crispa TaxID=139825 RepID=A0A401H392_9APHY|nr:hypothetical protein SCP_1402890 [Sparassis crispa]GBE88881.1 hypothetical protein SCP_1402890 [Sparassis crispa]
MKDLAEIPPRPRTSRGFFRPHDTLTACEVEIHRTPSSSAAACCSSSRGTAARRAARRIQRRRRIRLCANPSAIS